MHALNPEVGSDVLVCCFAYTIRSTLLDRWEVVNCTDFVYIFYYSTPRYGVYRFHKIPHLNRTQDTGWIFTDPGTLPSNE